MQLFSSFYEAHTIIHDQKVYIFYLPYHLTDSDQIRFQGFTMNTVNQLDFSLDHPLQSVIYMKLKLKLYHTSKDNHC
jgi:hypothetical protein